MKWRLPDSTHAPRVSIAVLVLVSVSSCAGTASNETTDVAAASFRSGEVDAAAGFQSRMLTCLTDRGWPVKGSDGGWGILYDGEQLDEEAGLRYSQAQDECMGESGPLPTFQPLSDVEIRRYYALNLDVAQCLEREGMPVAEPPSEDVYVEGYRAAESGGNVETWDPYSQLPAEQFDELLRACPQPSIEDF